MTMRILLISATITLLSGCFVFIPTGLIVRALQGSRYCVSKEAYVGGKVRMNDGKIATVTKINGPTSDCPNALLPINAELTFDNDDASKLNKPAVKQNTGMPIRNETQKVNTEKFDKLHESDRIPDNEHKRVPDKITTTQTGNNNTDKKQQELDDLHKNGVLSEEDYNKAKKRLTELQKLNELRQNGTLTDDEYNKAKDRLPGK